MRCKTPYYRSATFAVLVVASSSATAAIALSGSADAASLTLGSGTFSPASCTPVCDGSFTAGAETGTIDDTYLFSITSGALLQTASATNSSAAPGEQISNFTIDLFSGTPSGPNSILAAGAGAKTDATSQTTGNLPDTSLNPGTYFLAITGTDAGEATTYSGSFSFAEQTATPIPGALPLFATGLGALGLLGWRRKRNAGVSLLGAA